MLHHPAFLRPRSPVESDVAFIVVVGDNGIGRRQLQQAVESWNHIRISEHLLSTSKAVSAAISEITGVPQSKIALVSAQEDHREKSVSHARHRTVPAHSHLRTYSWTVDKLASRHAGVQSATASF